MSCASGAACCICLQLFATETLAIYMFGVEDGGKLLGLLRTRCLSCCSSTSKARRRGLVTESGRYSLPRAIFARSLRDQFVGRLPVAFRLSTSLTVANTALSGSLSQSISGSNCGRWRNGDVLVFLGGNTFHARSLKRLPSPCKRKSRWIWKILSGLNYCDTLN